jgi:hypothetical protein
MGLLLLPPSGGDDFLVVDAVFFVGILPERSGPRSGDPERCDAILDGAVPGEEQKIV